MSKQMNKNAKQRQQILQVLYTARERQAGKPNSNGWTAEADIKDAVGDCVFGLSVLEELGFVRRDGFRLRITGQGVVECERMAAQDD